MESRKTEFIEAESRLVVARGWGVGGMRCWSKGTNFYYKRSEFWGSNIQLGDYS